MNAETKPTPRKAVAQAGAKTTNKATTKLAAKATVKSTSHPAAKPASARAPAKSAPRRPGPTAGEAPPTASYVVLIRYRPVATGTAAPVTMAARTSTTAPAMEPSETRRLTAAAKPNAATRGRTWRSKPPAWNAARIAA